MHIGEHGLLGVEVQSTLAFGGDTARARPSSACRTAQPPRPRESRRRHDRCDQRHEHRIHHRPQRRNGHDPRRRQDHHRLGGQRRPIPQSNSDAHDRGGMTRGGRCLRKIRSTRSGAGAPTPNSRPSAPHPLGIVVVGDRHGRAVPLRSRHLSRHGAGRGPRATKSCRMSSVKPRARSPRPTILDLGTGTGETLRRVVHRHPEAPARSVPKKHGTEWPLQDLLPSLVAGFVEAARL